MFIFINYLVIIRAFRCKKTYDIWIIIKHSPIGDIIRNGGLKINSIENLSGTKSSGGMSLDATLAKDQH
jgi:hypothetical protein